MEEGQKRNDVGIYFYCFPIVCGLGTNKTKIIKGNNVAVGMNLYKRNELTIYDIFQIKQTFRPA